MTKKPDAPDPQHAICIIGAGRVGGAFALVLAKRGWRVRLVSRNPRRAALLMLRRRNLSIGAAPVAAKYFLLAVPDGAIKSNADSLARWLNDHAAKNQQRDAVATQDARRQTPDASHPTFLHTSGARPVSDLQRLRKFGPIGALHSLLAIPDAAEGAKALPGATLTFQGELRAFPAAVLLGNSLRCPLITLPRNASRLRYHAAAVIASNLPYAVWLQAEKLAAPLLGGSANARAALLPLIRAALRNYERSGGAGLTGPARRGDRALIRAESRALRGVTRETYDLLNEYLLGAAKKL